MPISTDFDYNNKLSLDKVKLVGRSRINDLGGYELTIQYSGVTSAMREDSLEWLEANRLEMTNPSFSFKTYEGVWRCVDIVYNEDSSIIKQRFKVDVGVGNLGNTDDEADYSLQTGDLTRISDGMKSYRAYYWRVTNPTDYDIPTTSIDGEIWSKTSNDNGDGTYDIIIGKDVEQSLSSTSAVNSSLYTEETVMTTNTTEQSFVGSGYGSETETLAITGQIKRIDNAPQENGKFRTSITTRTSTSFRYPSTEGTSFQWYSDWDVSQPSHYILGRNRTLAQFATDQGLLPITCVRTHSLSINDDGTCNYTINGYV